MQTIYELVALDIKNEHDLNHYLEHTVKFYPLRIIDGNGDIGTLLCLLLGNQETGMLKRMKNIYGKSNRFKIKESCYSALNYKERLLRFLRDGYN